MACLAVRRVSGCWLIVENNDAVSMRLAGHYWLETRMDTALSFLEISFELIVLHTGIRGLLIFLLQVHLPPGSVSRCYGTVVT